MVISEYEPGSFKQRQRHRRRRWQHVRWENVSQTKSQKINKGAETECYTNTINHYYTPYYTDATITIAAAGSHLPIDIYIYVHYK